MEKAAGGSPSGAHPLDSWPSFARAVTRASLFGKSSAVSGVVGLELRLRLDGVRGVSHRESPDTSSHCSHCRRKSVEGRLLWCVPLRPLRNTSFGRGSGSVQAPVSFEVTFEGAASSQREQASCPAVVVF